MTVIESSRCSACDQSCRLVLGSGPLPAKVLIIGEKPGQEEDHRREPFVGMTGKELDNTYLPLAGLDREDVRVTNAVKCRLGQNNNTPTPKQIDACARHWLRREVLECRPELIMLLGATACSLVPKIELDKEHGFPLHITATDSEYFAGYEGWVVPMYHPAAGLHDSSQMIPLLEDFERLRAWRNGKWSVPINHIDSTQTEYRVLTKPADFESVVRSVYGWLPMDTEDDAGKPWSLQFSTAPGNGYLIYAGNHKMLRWFERRILPCFRGVYLHFAGHDLDVLERMGVNVSTLEFRDTMQEAYQLGNLPQGLKALGWRLLGIRMQSWQDVVLPHSHRVMRDWLMQRWDDLTDSRTRVEIKLKTKTKILYKPTETERAVRRILSHSHKPEYDLWEKAKEAGLSGYPQRSIRHVPEAEAVRYAAMDADVTGRVSLVLNELRNAVVGVGGEWAVADADRDG